LKQTSQSKDFVKRNYLIHFFKKKYESRIVRNSSVSLSFILARNEKVEHYIRIKTHKLIVLRFWVESDISALYG